MPGTLRTALLGAVFATSLAGAGPVWAATVKVGVMAPLSGPFATVGQTF